MEVSEEREVKLVHPDPVNQISSALGCFASEFNKTNPPNSEMRRCSWFSHACFMVLCRAVYSLGTPKTSDKSSPPAVTIRRIKQWWKRLDVYTKDSPSQQMDRDLCCCWVIKSCSTLCDPMGLPGSSVRGISHRLEEYWSMSLVPSPGDLPEPGIEPLSPALEGRFFTTREALDRHLGLSIWGLGHDV